MKKALEALKKENRFYLQLPCDLTDHDGMRIAMFDFKSKQEMRCVRYDPLSFIILDLRLSHQVEAAKHRN